MEANETKRMRELEVENTKLKRLLADAMLDNVALKDVISKKWSSYRGKVISKTYSLIANWCSTCVAHWRN